MNYYCSKYINEPISFKYFYLINTYVSHTVLSIKNTTCTGAFSALTVNPRDVHWADIPSSCNAPVHAFQVASFIKPLQ